MGSLSVLPFEEHRLTFLDHEVLGRILEATELAEPMEIGKRAARKNAQTLAPEDRVELEVPTPSGVQRKVFLTPSGVLQVVSMGRSRKCARLRKVICDFYVGAAPTLERLLLEIQQVKAELADLRCAELRLPLPRLTAEVKRSLKGKFMTAAAFLMRETGQRQKPGMAVSLAHKTRNLCQQRGWVIKRFHRGNSNP